MTFDPLNAINRWSGQPQISSQQLQDQYRQLGDVYTQMCGETPREGMSQTRYERALLGFDITRMVYGAVPAYFSLPQEFRQFLSSRGCPDGSPREDTRRNLILHYRVLGMDHQSRDGMTVIHLENLREALRTYAFSVEEENALERIRLMMVRGDEFSRDFGWRLLNLISWEGNQPRVPDGFVDFVQNVATEATRVAATFRYYPFKMDYMKVIINGFMNVLPPLQNISNVTHWQADLAHRIHAKGQEDGRNHDHVIAALVLLFHQGEEELAVGFYDALEKVSSLRPRRNVVSLIFLALAQELTDDRRALIAEALQLAQMENERIEEEARRMSDIDLAVIRGSFTMKGLTTKDEYEWADYRFRDSGDRYFPHHFLEGVAALLRYPAAHPWTEQNVAYLLKMYVDALTSGDQKSQEMLDIIIPLLNELLGLHANLEAEDVSIDRRSAVIATSNAAGYIDDMVRSLKKGKFGNGAGGNSSAVPPVSGSPTPAAASSGSGASNRSETINGFIESDELDELNVSLDEEIVGFWDSQIVISASTYHLTDSTFSYLSLPGPSYPAAYYTLSLPVARATAVPVWTAVFGAAAGAAI